MPRGGEDHSEIKNKVDQLIGKDPNQKLSREMQQVYEKHQFVSKVYNDPIRTNKFDKKINHTQINLQDFINLRLFPRSIYVTDHLIRLAAYQRFEDLKKFLPKKRKLSFDGWWIILLLIVGICVVLLILMLLPGLLGGMNFNFEGLLP